MRSILVYADSRPGLAARMETGLALARENNGHLTVLVDTPIARYMAFDTLGQGIVAPEAISEALENADREAQRIDAELAGTGVPYEVVRSEVEPVISLSQLGRLADVIVLSRDSGVAGELAIGSRTPILVLNDNTPLPSPLARGCVAWDGGDEAALALRLGVPLLERCQSVSLLTVGEKKSGFSTQDALRYLERHGISAEHIDLPRRGSIEDTLAAGVEQVGAQLLVMGAFGHSRMRQFFFGGVTRHFLESRSGPALLLAH